MSRRGRVALAGTLWLLGACAEEKESSHPTPVVVGEPPVAAFFPPPELKRLRLSTTPHLDPERLERSYQGLTGYLSRRLGVPVELHVASSYDELGALVRDGEVDVAVFSPFSYVRAQRSGTRIRPVVSVISDGSATSAGYIVVRADSGLRRLEDLRGKRFAYVDQASTSGYLYPRKLMLDRGVDPDRFFGETAFLGNHEAALLAVREGRFDAGATYQGALQALRRSRGVDPLSFRIIAKTQRTPHSLFCAREDMPPSVVDELRRSLLLVSSRTEEGRKILEPLQINGFVPPDEALFEEVRQVAGMMRDTGAH